MFGGLGFRVVHRLWGSGLGVQGHLGLKRIVFYQVSGGLRLGPPILLAWPFSLQLCHALGPTGSCLGLMRVLSLTLHWANGTLPEFQAAWGDTHAIRSSGVRTRP